MNDAQQQAIRALRDAARELGHTPSSSWWQEQGRTPSYGRIVELFLDGWTGAIRSASLAPLAPHAPTPETWTTEHVIQSLEMAAAELGHSPPAAWWREQRRQPDNRVVERMLGGGDWDDALATAGLPPSPSIHEAQAVTRDRAIAALREVTAEIGRPPTSTWWQQNRRHPPRYDEIVLLLGGSWDRALNAANLRGGPGDNQSPGSRQHLLGELVAASDELGHSPDPAWWQENRSLRTYDALIQQFETWPRALAAAGLPTTVAAAERTSIEGQPADDRDDIDRPRDAPESLLIDRSMQIWSLPIARLAIGARGLAALQRAGIVTVGQVADLAPAHVEALGPVAQDGLAGIRNALALQGLRLPLAQGNGIGQLPTTTATSRQHVGLATDLVPPRAVDRPPSGGAGVDADLRLEELDLTVRTFNALRRAGFQTLGDVEARHISELEAIPNFGQKSLAEILSVITERSLSSPSAERRPSATPCEEPTPERLDRPEGRSRFQGAGSEIGLEELNLSVRTSNGLRRAGLLTLGDVAARNVSELAAIPNFGRKSVGEILSALAAHSLETATTSASQLTGSKTRPNVRAAAMITSIAEGATLQEVADQHGVTRERVRQILKQHGASARTGAEARRARSQELVDTHREEIMRDFRRGIADSDTARRLDLPVSGVAALIRQLATPQDRTMRRSNSQRAAEQIFSDADIVDAIREVARRYGRTPSTGEYARAARDEGLPSIATVHNRLTWRGALEAAGLEAPKARREYKTQWTAEACWRVLRELVVELGDVPSINRYEDLARMDDSLPSAATLRNRLGGWQAVTAQLARLPRGSDVLSRLQDEAGDQGPIDSEAIWMAYLAELITEIELAVLLIAGDFVWHPDFGDPPTVVAEHLRGTE